MRPRDTSPEAWKFQMDLMRRKGPEERLEIAIEQTAMLRVLSRAVILRDHPRASKREIFLRLAQRALGQGFDKVFGDEWRTYGSDRRHA